MKIYNKLERIKKSLDRANMTLASVLRALENPILTDFPYELSNVSNFDDISEQTGYRYNK